MDMFKAWVVQGWKDQLSTGQLGAWAAQQVRGLIVDWNKNMTPKGRESSSWARGQFAAIVNDSKQKRGDDFSPKRRKVSHKILGTTAEAVVLKLANEFKAQIQTKSDEELKELGISAEEKDKDRPAPKRFADWCVRGLRKQDEQSRIPGSGVASLGKKAREHLEKGKCFSNIWLRNQYYHFDFSAPKELQPAISTKQVAVV